MARIGFYEDPTSVQPDPGTIQSRRSGYGGSNTGGYGGYGGGTAGQWEYRNPSPWGSQSGSNNTGINGGVQYPQAQPGPTQTGDGTGGALNALGTVSQSGIDAMRRTAAAAATPQPATQQPRTSPYAAMAGFDYNRLNDPTDLSGKYVYNRWIQDNWLGQGQQYGADAVRAFLAANPNWEGLNVGSNDPLIRQKQDYLNTLFPGRQSIWQDVIGDSGPGGANRLQFGNAEGDPALGFAAPSTPADPYATTPGATDPALLSLLLSPYAAMAQQQYAPPPPAPTPTQTPSILNDPNFWQQFMNAMQPQPGYSAAAAPTFGGAQYGGYGAQPVQNPQLMTMMSQLIASLAGGQ